MRFAVRSRIGRKPKRLTVAQYSGKAWHREGRRDNALPATFAGVKLFTRRRRIGLYLNSAARLPAPFRRKIMGKVRQSNKETKKQPALTPKEKKVAKQSKKHGQDVMHPLVTR